MERIVLRTKVLLAVLIRVYTLIIQIIFVCASLNQKFLGLEMVSLIPLCL